MQRVPHLVGCIGTIREVPVHPTTWFKIEFPDGAIVTFRPSAFRLADSAQNSDDDDDDHPLVVTFPKKASRNPTVYPNQEIMNTTMDNPDLMVGATVRVREGRYFGETGEVVKVGNGWVLVLLDGGEVSKRSHELEVIGRNPSTVRSRSGRAIRTHHLFNGMAQRPQKIPRVHPMFLISSAGDQDGVIVSKQDDSTGPNHGIASPTTKVGKNAGPSISFLYELERQALDCPFPLIDTAERKAKRHRVQAYVDRESDAVLGRPNFSLWLSRLHQSLCVSDVDKEKDSLDMGDTRGALKRSRQETLLTSIPSTEESSEAMSDTESFDEGVPTLVGQQTNGLMTSRSSEAFFVDAVFSLARCARVIPTSTITGSTTTYNDADDASESTGHRMDSDGNNSDDMDFSPSKSTNYHPMTSSNMTMTLHKKSLTRFADMSTCSLDEDPSAMLVKIRADSMYAETDNEYSENSPELSGMVRGSCGSPPPLELPPSHAATMSSSSTSYGTKITSSKSSTSLSSACPKDYSAWTQLVANVAPTVTFMTN